MKDKWLNSSLACNLGLPTQKVYKYLSSQFVDSFVNGSSIRIGTLNDFRDIEKHQYGISDSMEGSASTYFADTEHVSGQGREKLQKDLNPLFGFPEKTVIDLNHIEVVVSHTDCYIFSTSLDSGDLTGKSITIDDPDEYNSVVEINNMFRLAELLVGRLFELGLCTGQYWCKPVVYRKMKRQYDKDGFHMPDPFLKDNEFENQREFRVMIEATNREIQPEIIKIDKLPDYLLRRLT